MNKEKAASRARRGLIALLTVTAVLLLTRTTLFGGLLETYRLPAASAGTADTAETQQSRTTGAIRLQAAVVCRADGSRFGTAWQEEAPAAILRRFSADLSEALGSASAPEPMTENAFFAALNGEGVFLRFFTAQPVAQLSLWLGTAAAETVGGRNADCLFLLAEEGGVSLCFRTAEGCFRCGTAVLSEPFRGRLAEYSANGAQFAFELPLLSGCDGCTVLLEELPDAAVLKCTVPALTEEYTDRLLDAFHMNSYLASSYLEPDGTVVYVGENATMRLGKNGSVAYRSSAARSTETTALTDAVSLAWQTAEQTVGGTCGIAQLCLLGAEKQENSNTVLVTLGYVVGGIPVAESEVRAAEISVCGGQIVQAQMSGRCFADGGEATALLPCLQAAAIASAEHTSPMLTYDGSGEALKCDWVKYDG